MREIIVPGFTANVVPDDRPAVGCYGVEGTGKTRFAVTMPDPIGVISLDKKSKRTVKAVAEQLGKRVVVNTHNIISDRDAIRLAMRADDTKTDLEELEKDSKVFYRKAVDQVFDMGAALAESKDIESIVVDTGSQMWQWILYKHFGRLSKIPPVSRGNANQDMIDFINMCRTKNLCVIHRSKEVWKDTGRVDKNGEKIKEPSGKFEPDGFKGIGGFLTLNIELNNIKGMKDPEKKFRCKVLTCQTNYSLEGQDLYEHGMAGEEITWDNLMMIAGM